ncbi:hypothetical protein LTR08_001942 [Meristemomyces frigidus]|nr:hypothetical protein LTR08_001942 [Meristemomyces frigidus]
MAEDSKKNQVLAVAIIFTVLSWVTVCLRIWVRAGMLGNFGRDDWTMLATQGFFTIYLVCQFGGVVYGTGQHLSALEPANAETAQSYWFFCEFFYIITTVLLKVAIGLFLLRIATKPLHIWIIRIISICTVIFGSALAFIILFQCWPIRAFWTLDPNDGKCIEWRILSGLIYGISALNIVADWTFGILPIFIVRGLVMSRRQKVLVSCILAFAAIGSTATIVRMPYIHTFSQAYLGWNGDFLYDTVGLAVWTTVEIGVGITAGCIATLRPLLQLALSMLGMNSSRRRTASGRTPSRHLPKQGLPLDGLAPSHGNTTTITGNDNTGMTGHWHSRDNSQEQLDPLSENIMKQVVVEYGEVESLSAPSNTSDEHVHVYKR